MGDTDKLFAHLEDRLGEFADAREWEMARIESVGILRFPGAPRPAATTYATFGLSRAELHVTDRLHVRLELLLAVRDEDEPNPAVSWLLALAEHFIETGTAPEPEERHGLWPLVDGSELDGACLVEPLRYDAGFARHTRGWRKDDVLIRELVPVAAVEAGFAGDYGWTALAGVFEREGADLLDLRRPSAVRRTERAEPCPTCGQADDYFLPDGTPVPERHAHG